MDYRKLELSLLKLYHLVCNVRQPQIDRFERYWDEGRTWAKEYRSPLNLTLREMKEIAGCPVYSRRIRGCRAYYRNFLTECIVLDSRYKGPERIILFLHELAHKLDDVRDKRYYRELVAESCSYIVAEYFKIINRAAPFYIAAYMRGRGGAHDILRLSPRIMKVSLEIVRRIEKILAEKKHKRKRRRTKK